MIKWDRIVNNSVILKTFDMCALACDCDITRIQNESNWKLNSLSNRCVYEVPTFEDHVRVCVAWTVCKRRSVEHKLFWRQQHWPSQRYTWLSVFSSFVSFIPVLHFLTAWPFSLLRILISSAFLKGKNIQKSEIDVACCRFHMTSIERRAKRNIS